jgi:Holliday junction resolvase RusA-like endonuclease
MQDAITFTVPCVPVAQPRQRHRVAVINGHTRAMNYTPASSPVNAFKATVRLAASAAYQGPPLDEPLGLSAVFVLPRPKSLCWKRRPMPRCRHVGRCDLDNFTKALKDALKGLLWVDDNRVLEYLPPFGIVVASGDEQPHVEVTVRRLADVWETTVGVMV